MMHKLHRNNQGETIVGVLISVAVVGLVLVSTYVIVRGSANLGQAARERTQALKVVESQLERLKYTVVASNPAQDPFSPPAAFCINDDLKIVDLTAMLPMDCSLGDAVTGGEREFEFTIVYHADGLNPASFYDDDLFVLTAQWLRIGSDRVDRVVIYYRIHQAPMTFTPTDLRPQRLANDYLIGQAA